MCPENECPVCDQGIVTPWRIKALGELIQVCNECDLVWEDGSAPPDPATTTVEQYLGARGLPPLRAILEPA